MVSISKSAPPLVFGITCASIHLTIVTIFINPIVDQPYMDEIFHVDQVQRYCARNYSSWNQKITTPPALYWLTLIFVNISDQHCHVQTMRIFNSLLIFFTSILIWCWRAKLDNTDRWNVTLTSANILLLPVLVHSSLLYYTDLLSLCTIAFIFNCTPNRKSKYLEYLPSSSMIVIAAFAGLLSIACRQTNIVWIAFYAALVAIDAAANYLHITNPDRLPIELLTNRNRWSAIGIGIRHIWPFILLAAIFIGAVCWNHGLALGDRTAHQLVYHGMQLCYAYTFMVASAFPAIALNNPIVLIRELHRRWRLLITIAISIIPIVIAFNYAHPYLLADNRHFTFYLWRRLLSPYRFAFIPVYVISMAIAAISIDNESKRFRIGLAIATILVTIPNGLLEFRKYTQLYVISIVLGYFIVPYVVWRLHILRNVNRWILIAEMTLNVIINCVVVYLFLYRPFRWTHVDELQRFMW